MRLSVGATALLGLLAFGITALLLFWPYLIIRIWAQYGASLIRTWGPNEAVNRFEFPWSHYVQEGLAYDEFVFEAARNPRRFTHFAGCLRLVGGFLLLTLAANLLLLLLAYFAGVLGV
jgi:hypothetical protein